MTYPVSDMEALRTLVREHVVAVLRRLEQDKTPSLAAQPGAAVVGASSPAARRLIVLFLGRQKPGEELLNELTGLAEQGFGLCAAFSHSFRQFCPPEEVLARLPKTTLCPELVDEPGMLGAVEGVVGLVAATLSVNTAAKLAHAIDDSLPSFLISQALLAGKPVFVARDLASFGSELEARHPGAAPAFRRTAENHFHKVEQLGVQFVSTAGLNAALRAHFTEWRNETPERLAKQRPSLKREFVTAEDLWQALSRGQKEFVHARDAIITDQARDFAAAQGLALKSL